MRLIVTLTLTAFTLLSFATDAHAEKRQPRRVKNDVEIITTRPNLPAEIHDPARERRNHDWLSGYGYNAQGASEAEQGQTTEDEQPPMRRERGWRRMRR